MEELETLESTECPECPGPPPEFRLPPPPRPPFLTDGTFCSEEPLTEIEDCVAIPVSSIPSIIPAVTPTTFREFSRILQLTKAIVRSLASDRTKTSM